MSHIVAKEAYKSLEERLNRFPLGAAPTKTLYKILEMLYSKKEAELVAQLYHEYMNVEEDFIKGLFGDTTTNLGRAFVNEQVLTPENSLSVLDYERSTHVIEDASHIGISMCYCRHKMQHMGTACDAPMDVCMTFNNVASSLIKRGYARQVDVSECKDLLNQSYEANLVQFGENIRNRVSFICNCCGCCCEALLAQKRFGHLYPITTSNFLPTCNEDECIHCGKCEKECPIDVIQMVEKDNVKVPVINTDQCIGCGICVRNCPNKSLTLKSREQRVLTPVNSVHKSVLMAIEKGQLQELLFDNKALISHRALAAIFSSILKLSPLKKAMASEQMRSVYLEKLLARKSDIY